MTSTNKTTQPPVAPQSQERELTNGWMEGQGAKTDGFKGPDEIILNKLAGTTGADHPKANEAPKNNRVSNATERSALRNKVGKDDKTMFNQLNRFDDTPEPQPSPAAQGTLMATPNYKTSYGNFAGQKYKP